MSKKEVKKYQQQERKEKMEQQKREKELRKNFMVRKTITCRRSNVKDKIL